MVANDVARDYGPYYILLAAGIVQFAHALYFRYLRKRDEKEVAERKEEIQMDLEWRRKTDYQLEELRELMRTVRYVVKEKLGMDIRMDR